MAENEEENKFVNIYRAKDIRVTNLETVKDIIKSEKIHYTLKLLRTKKIKVLEELRNEAKELELLFTKLYQYLPEHRLIEEKKTRISQRKENRKSKGSKKSKAKSTDEAELLRLEKTLSLIEDKLRSM